MERQARWRKAWYATVERDGDEIPIYVRGDKQIDAEPFPGLDREAAILTALEAGGIRVPHVYGMSTDPVGIIMDRVPGTRDIAEAVDDAQRESIAEQYIDELAAIHRLDLQPFIDAGITVPDSAEGIALAYVDANEKLYRRTKTGPEPLVEFALRWVRRHVPQGRRRPAFILADTGQFLYVDGKITCVYDLEAAHVGDPLFDLASLRTRAGTEPLGADIAHLVRRYEEATGEAVDPGGAQLLHCRLHADRGQFAQWPTVESRAP
ncbi:phosphotransferase [Gordonia hydrophobica]|uniref:Phosphotransferase n=1 Tax=Gordonia hydrophobica TaxID=40516 RepID=A0ABZ2TZQ7_9ACTN|nr:phosphotransferase [Gordonia hydrophobica]MBM7369189.1 aminoglycoside phosphotransferase (APT) family kinase protein [Gordonia hydrophobica]